MESINIFGWELEIDPTATAQDYAAGESGFPEKCGCLYCRNFIAARHLAYPEPFIRLLSRLGVPQNREFDVTAWREAEPGVILYDGIFYFVGRIVSGPEKLFMNHDGSPYQGEPQTADFSMWFGRPSELEPDSSESSGWEELSFTTRVPVVLTEEDILCDRKPPEDMIEFFPWLKDESQKLWKTFTGYDSPRQEGSWKSGLRDNEITKYEREMGFTFPEIYRTFLKSMNGTNKKTIVDWYHIYEDWSETPSIKVDPGYYCFPRDLKKVKKILDRVCELYRIDRSQLDQNKIPQIMPILEDRFLVMNRCDTNPVLALRGNSMVPYADSLNQFLLWDIFGEGLQQPNLPSIKVKFWLDK